MDQLLRNRAAVSASCLAAAACRDQGRFRGAGGQLRKKINDLEIIGKPVKPKFHGASFLKRPGELTPHGSSIGRRDHGAEFIPP
jgi:hypothetical protein